MLCMLKALSYYLKAKDVCPVANQLVQEILAPIAPAQHPLGACKLVLLQRRDALLRLKGNSV